LRDEETTQERTLESLVKRASKLNKKITTASPLLSVHSLLSNVFVYTQQGEDSMTGRTGQLIQVEQDKQNRRQNRTDKTGGSGQTRQAGQDRQDRTTKTGLPGNVDNQKADSKNRTARTDGQNETARMGVREGQVKQDCQHRVVRTVPQGQDNRSRTAVTKHPGQNSQKRTSRMEKHNGTDSRWHVHVEQDCRDRQRMA
jgi:hypothetical protein